MECIKIKQKHSAKGDILCLHQEPQTLIGWASFSKIAQADLKLPPKSQNAEDK
jgi:hypothetical protein